MDILVVSACSGRKRHEAILSCADIDDSDRPTLVDRHPEVTAPAVEQYTGREHEHVRRAVSHLRDVIGVNLDWHIVSAGFGLVDSRSSIPAYECTFGDRESVRTRLRRYGHDPDILTNSEEIRALGRELNIPSDLRELLTEEYDLVFVVLGATYLQTLSQVLLDFPTDMPAFAFVAEGASESVGECTWVPATETERAALGTTWLELRGYLFEMFAKDASEETLRNIASNPGKLPDEINL